MKGCEPDIAVCDLCLHYAFNGDETGAYVGKGRCEHPQHPHDASPAADSCGDFKCALCHETPASDEWPFPDAPPDPL